MAHRQVALSRHLLKRYTTVEVCAENFFGSAHLPRRKPAPNPRRYGSHAAIGLRDMHPDRQHDVVGKQLVNLLRIGKRQEHGAPKAGNHDVVDARSGLIT